MATAEPAPLHPTPVHASPLALLRAFLFVGVTSFGGGLGGHIHTLIRKRGWADDHSYAEAFTLAQLLPGSNATNLAAFLGMRLGGPRGSLTAVLGLLLPGLVAIALLTAVYFTSGTGLSPALKSALRGAAAAAVGVMANAALPVVKVSLRLPGGPATALLTFLALGVWRLDILVVLAVALPAGLWIHRPRGPKGSARG